MIAGYSSRIFSVHNYKICHYFILTVLLIKYIFITDMWNWSGTSLGVLPWQTNFQPWLQIYHTNE